MATAGGGEEATIQRILRITDVAEESLKFLAPIGGYSRMPLVSLEEAVEPLVPILPDVQSHAYVAKQNCKKPADKLTQDESASIMLYTMGWEPPEECLYVVLNTTLRATNRQQKLKPWYLFLRLLLNALFRLPLLPTIAYRGVKLDLSRRYIEGETIVWWGFSSCTTSVSVLKSELFLGKTGSRTMFTLHCKSARDIRKHSFYPVEDEVLVMAATQFKVMGSIDRGNLHIIQLEETMPPFPLLQPVPIVDSLSIHSNSPSDSTTTSSGTSKDKTEKISTKSQIDTHGAAASTSKKTGINSITAQMSDVKISASTNEGNDASSMFPLLRSHSNWTLDSEKYRSPTAENSSVQNLLDISPETYWTCLLARNGWVVFDLKHEYSINGIRIIGCENQSAPRNGRIDVSNSFNGHWLKIIDFICVLSQGNKNDFYFPSVKTRFIRVHILDNHGGIDIRIKVIGFFGVDMSLVDLLRQYGLENSLNTLLANGINDLETLDEQRDAILNSSDKYLDVNDHFQFIRFVEALRSPRLTFLKWSKPPKTTAIAGEKLKTFSVIGDEGATGRVKLEEKHENSPQATTILKRDLEPIQGHSLVAFRDYTFKYPGRYKIRVISLESPDIHTPWQEIVVGK
ncbi:unnamed protein product [Rotaria socialis]